jgi:hypothetical protein
MNREEKMECLPAISVASIKMVEAFTYEVDSGMVWKAGQRESRGAVGADVPTLQS